MTSDSSDIRSTLDLSTVSPLSQVIYINLHLTSINQALSQTNCERQIQQWWPVCRLSPFGRQCAWRTLNKASGDESDLWCKRDRESVLGNQFRCQFILSIQGRYSILNFSFHYSSKFEISWDRFYSNFIFIGKQNVKLLTLGQFKSGVVLFISSKIPRSRTSYKYICSNIICWRNVQWVTLTNR